MFFNQALLNWVLGSFLSTDKKSKLGERDKVILTSQDICKVTINNETSNETSMMFVLAKHAF